MTKASRYPLPLLNEVLPAALGLAAGLSLLAGCSASPASEGASAPGAGRPITWPAGSAAGAAAPATVITLAMPLNQVLARLRATGAKDVSGVVSLKAAQGPGEAVEQLWFVLPGQDGDGTCVRVVARGPAGSIPTVSLIEVGPPGEGYPGKERWAAVKRSVPRFDLASGLVPQ